MLGGWRNLYAGFHQPNCSKSAEIEGQKRLSNAQVVQQLKKKQVEDRRTYSVDFLKAGFLSLKPMAWSHNDLCSRDGGSRHRG